MAIWDWLRFSIFSPIPRTRPPLPDLPNLSALETVGADALEVARAEIACVGQVSLWPPWDYKERLGDCIDLKLAIGGRSRRV